MHSLSDGFALIGAHGAVDSQQTVDVELKSIIHEVQKRFDVIEDWGCLSGRQHFVDEVELV